MHSFKDIHMANQSVYFNYNFRLFITAFIFFFLFVIYEASSTLGFFFYFKGKVCPKKENSVILLTLMSFLSHETLIHLQNTKMYIRYYDILDGTYHLTNFFEAQKGTKSIVKTFHVSLKELGQLLSVEVKRALVFDLKYIHLVILHSL